MAKTKNAERKAIDKVFVLLGVAATVVLVGAGALLLYGSQFATGMVKDQLSAQKIYFPAEGSKALAALPPEDQAEVSKYAGEQLVTGEQAKVYAENYIGAHLKKVADGKTYSEVSEAAMANPTDQKLARKKPHFSRVKHSAACCWVRAMRFGRLA